MIARGTTFAPGTTAQGYADYLATAPYGVFVRNMLEKPVSDVMHHLRS